jgi:two-component system, sensor histidine kinase PdtaS
MPQRLGAIPGSRVKGRGTKDRMGWRQKFLSPGSAFTQLLILTVLLPVLFFAVAAYRDWRDIENEAGFRVVHLMDALTEHALRVFQTHRLIAYAIGDRTAGQDWGRIEGSADLHGYLAVIANDFPEVEDIWLIDRNGELRASSGRFPADERNLSEETSFTELRDGNSPFTVGAATERSYFTINFRHGGTGLDFDGMVRISVSPHYFESFYSATYPNEGVIALVHEDGKLLVRYPALPRRTIGADVPSMIAPNSRTFDGSASEAAGLVLQNSPVDGVVRYYGYARIADFPVYVGVGLGQQELFRLWRSRLQSYGAYFIPAGFALLLLALYAWRSHRDLENVVELRTEALSLAIAEKNQLLKEVHHRVKNNMQIISSLIRMQDRVQTSPDETIRRVQAMALVHDLIYTHDEFASVNLATYAHRMLESLIHLNSGKITFDLDLQPVTVALDRAMPFALILSEIVTNATRHAFPERRGKISIALHSHGDTIELCVHDDGIGHNPEVDGRGFGMRLVKSLAVQLGAETEFRRDNGTHFRMTFPTDAPSERTA